MILKKYGLDPLILQLDIYNRSTFETAIHAHIVFPRDFLSVCLRDSDWGQKSVAEQADTLSLVPPGIACLSLRVLLRPKVLHFSDQHPVLTD